ncbi:MAG: cation:proton antiporter [Candidatus Midichloria sp.]|nr:cation:proton antiporter [Candidatus Midichloria sp.]
MHDTGYLPDVLILLLVSIITVVLLRKFRTSPVLGYLVVGAIIGSNGLDLIKEPGYTTALGEFGVVFLLFVIGLELTFERLIKMRVLVFGFGGLQFLLTALVFYLAYLVIDYYIDIKLPQTMVIVISLALALSSTAIVLQVLAENGTQSSPIGRLSLAVLLMQDFAVVPLLAIIPILNQGNDMLLTIGWASLKALGAIIAITLFGRWCLRPFFSLIASVKTDEVYVTTTLLIVLGAAWTTSQLGLSTAMGAFLAGILIAETEYRNRVEDSIIPFQGLFMSLFFITVGMSIDWRFIMSQWSDILVLSAGIILIKALVIFILCNFFSYQRGESINASLLLSQGGEFAFILFNIAASQGVITHDLAQFLFMVVAVTMAVTPLLSIIGTKIEDVLDNGLASHQLQELRGIGDLSEHVILAGFGRVGRVVAYMLEQEQINYVAVDSNASLAKQAREDGFPVYHGNLADLDTLNAVGAKQAAAIILSMSDKISVRKAVKVISLEFSSLPIITRAEDLRHSRNLKKMGAEITVPTTIETGLQLGGVALKNLGIVEHAILSIKEKIRKNNYTLVEEMELFR